MLMIMELCLQCLSHLNKTNIGVLRAIVVDNRLHRRQALEKTIQDGRHWLKHLRERRFESSSDGFQEHYILKIGKTLESFSKDWSSFSSFLNKAAVHAQECQKEIPNKDYRDLLAEVRAESLKYEEDFNKEVAFELIYKIYSALERRIN